MTETLLIKPLVITEGKTDWMHLKAAFTWLQEDGHFSNLHFDLWEYGEDMGDTELLKICQTVSRIPQARPLIFVFDRDNQGIIRQAEDENSLFKHWGRYVYSFAIPIPDFRQGVQDAISIEFYYKDDEIKQQDVQGRRLFLNDEFGDSGWHVSDMLNCTELNKVRRSDTCVIDKDVFNRDNINQALSKNSFARNVLEQEEGFSNFDFSQFYKIFDVIAAIVSDVSVTAIAADHLRAYSPLPLSISSPRSTSSGNRYSVLRVKDTSHAGAKRYAADILISASLDRHEIKQIIRAETEILKAKEFYRNEHTESRWRGVPAHIVWLTLFITNDDAADYNAYCRSEWIHSDLPSKFSPIPMKVNDAIGDISITWNNEYHARRDIYDKYRVTPDEYLRQASEILAALKPVVNRAISFSDQMESGTLPYDNYVEEMKTIGGEINALDDKAGGIGTPPLELIQLDETFRSMVGSAFNITLPFSERGLATWERSNQQILVRQATKYYLQDQQRIEAELQQLYGNLS